MGRPRSRFAPAVVLHLVVGAGLVACGTDEASDPVVERQGPILGGVPDTTDGAVMALLQHQKGSTTTDACTGTVIAKAGASGILLTAGHCVATNDGTAVTVPVKAAPVGNFFVVPGNDWQTGLTMSQYFDVAQVAVHPSYDGSVNSPFDLALVRFVGATPTMPLVPALAPADDKLAVGSAFTLVGYGETETNTDNSQRRKVDRTIETLSDRQFLYDQRDHKGACSGDSGGPALVQTPNGVRVAGVTSYGDTTCMTLGVSVRVSPLSSFIQSFITGSPLMLTCEECTAAALSPGNGCIAQADACLASVDCGKFLNCEQGCTTAACAEIRRSGFAAGAAVAAAIPKCQCLTCAKPCAQEPACAAYLPMTSGAGGTGGQPPPAAKSGCSCSTGAAPSSFGGALLLAAVGSFAVARRRRRR